MTNLYNFSASLVLSLVVIFAAISDGIAVEPALSVEQIAWHNASLAERKIIAENIGEDGARSLARRSKYEVIYNGTEKGGISQGLDQVYRAPNGKIIVYEAKGGNAYVRQSYGEVQGTSEWAVK